MLAPSHIVLLGLVILLALVVFGPKRLPELGQSVGRAIQEFKHASSQAAHEFNQTSADLHHTVAFNPVVAPEGTPVVTSEGNPVVVVTNGVAPVTHSATGEAPSDQGQAI